MILAEDPVFSGNAGFATSLPNTIFRICGDVEEVGFPIQNVYKMTYGDENATFEPLNLSTRERLPDRLQDAVSFCQVVPKKKVRSNVDL